MSPFMDVTCPSCGAKLRGQLVKELRDVPTMFVPYPHRARRWKGWCHEGTWPHVSDTLDLEESA